MILVAEIAAAHGQSLKAALDLVDAAKEAGASHLKLQTWDVMTVSDRLIESGPWAGKRLAELYEECKLPWDWHPIIFARAKRIGLTAFSTPFDAASVDFLETLDCPMYKIASFEITDLALIRRAAVTRKPIIISTGMASEDEIEDAVEAASTHGGGGITLLHCVSAYPAKPEDYSLKTMADMRNRFGVDVGLSDHTQGPEVAMGAVALGATIIEKHLTLPGMTHADAGFASTPDHFAAMARGCRAVEAARGSVRYGPVPAEADQLQFRRSIWAIADIEAGEELTRQNIAVLRPIGGILASNMAGVLGCLATQKIARGEPVTEARVHG